MRRTNVGPFEHVVRLDQPPLCIANFAYYLLDPRDGFVSPRLHVLVRREAHRFFVYFDIGKRGVCFGNARLQGHLLACEIGIAVDRKRAARHHV